MTDLNYLILEGRITRDATMNVSASGVKYTRFAIATNSTYINKSGEKIEKADFFPMCVFNKNAENILPYLVKGRLVIIEGKIGTHQWDSNGEKRSDIQVFVKHIHLRSLPKENKNQDENQENSPDSSETLSEEEEKILVDEIYADAEDFDIY